MADPRAGHGAACSTATAGPRWHVVMSQPRKELYAAGHLQRQGFETFTPVVERKVRHARKTQTVLRPFFPRYLFISLDMGVHAWRSVLGTFGVTTLVMDGERPRAVPVGVVEALQAAFEGGGPDDYRERLVVGQQVRFLAGPFAEMLGTLVEMDDAGRVGVLMQILGSERVVAAPSGNLMPVTS